MYALGDQVQREMTVLFSDIRNFTRMSESMTPAETFRFINQYLGAMEPAISGHTGSSTNMSATPSWRSFLVGPTMPSRARWR